MDAAYIDTLVKKSAEFGGGKIHIIVNNAGFTWDGVIHKVRIPPSPFSLF
jgi:3-oxoacyl-[acyl-carrier protein] reductase